MPNTMTSDYYTAIAESDRLMQEVSSWVARDAIEREEDVVTDLDTDHHRMTCSDTTSFYTNQRNMWLTPEVDPVAIVDHLRDELVAQGYARHDSVDELQGNDQDPADGYSQIMQSPNGYLVTVSKWPDDAGIPGVSVEVMSPCVADPADKPDRWGR